MAYGKKRFSIRPYAIPVILACGIFFASYCFAKMVLDDPIEKDGEATVAKWNVEVSSDDDSKILDAGGSAQTYSLSVTNNSEVASGYSIGITNIPDGIKIGLDIASDSDLVTPVDGAVTFTNTGGYLGYTPPNNVRTHVLTLVAEPTAEKTQTGVDMEIKVLFAQSEPGV